MKRDAGLTLIELVLCVAILSILAAAAAPVLQISVKRGREVELRYSLRKMRRAIDQFHLSYLASGGTMPFPTAGANVPGQLPGSAPLPNQPNQPNNPNQPNQPNPAGGPQAPAGQVHSRVVTDQIPLIDHTNHYAQDTYGYPKSLRELVDGVPAQGGFTDNLVRFLRRIERDPMMPVDTIDDPNDDNFGWGVRCYQDEFEAEDDVNSCPEFGFYCEKNVYDVYSKSRARALDGTLYCQW